jgi:DNA-directed RNA polymerase specialized sigma24 family protein
VADHFRREGALKRGAGRVFALSQLDNNGGESPFDGMVADELTPDFLAMLDEQFQHLLGMLRDDRLREVVILRLEGYTVAEIAAKFGIGKRAVERKLQLIRSKFVDHLIQSE